jgi:AraC-like DNA-binding protein
MTHDWLYRIAPCMSLVGEQTNSDEWLDSRRVIYDYELMCFGAQGSHRLEFDDEVIDCPPYSYVIIPPGRWHVGRGSASHPIHRAWIHFDWVYDPRQADSPLMTFAPAEPSWSLVRQAPEFVPGPVLRGPLPDPRWFFDHHQRLLQHDAAGTSAARLACRPLLLDVLLHLLAPGASVARDHRDHHLAWEVREMLDTIAEEPFSTAPLIKPALAAQGKSYDHLARVFKIAYGITPVQYLNSRRVERAKHLLVTTQLTIAEIANRLGFEDVSYFSRLFRRWCGETPGEYRG